MNTYHVLSACIAEWLAKQRLGFALLMLHVLLWWCADSLDDATRSDVLDTIQAGRDALADGMP